MTHSRIIGLQVENFKRISAVDLSPNPQSILDKPSGVARQVLDEDAIIINLDGIPYITTISAAEYALQTDTRAKLLRKFEGKLITSGLLFPAKTGKTVYAHVGHSRYRMATYRFEQVMNSPGCIAPALYCPPREVIC